MRSAIKPKGYLVDSSGQISPYIPEEETHERLVKLRQKLYPKMFEKQRSKSPQNQRQDQDVILASEISIHQLSSGGHTESPTVHNQKELASNLIDGKSDIASRKQSVLSQLQAFDVASGYNQSQLQSLRDNTDRQKHSSINVNPQMLNFPAGTGTRLDSAARNRLKANTQNLRDMLNESEITSQTHTEMHNWLQMKNTVSQ